jgi:hypothetical protein
MSDPGVVPQFAEKDIDVDSVARPVGVPVTVTLPVRAVVEPAAAYVTITVQLPPGLSTVVAVQVPPPLVNRVPPPIAGAAVKVNVPVAVAL